MWLGERSGHLPAEERSELLSALRALPGQMEHVLETMTAEEASGGAIERVSAMLATCESTMFIGRGAGYPLACEGALKLKEISYIPAEGMPAAEMKHGPIALIDDGMPAVFVATKNSQYEKVISNIEEVRARGGSVIAVATEGDKQIRKLCAEVFYVPDIPEPLQPMITVVPLQLLAYHAAVLRGKDVDKPRNLAKSVTVE
jgi:glucosamine--fructose-6-phosphate aminotransferase (isomerizing)